MGKMLALVSKNPRNYKPFAFSVMAYTSVVCFALWFGRPSTRTNVKLLQAGESQSLPLAKATDGIEELEETLKWGEPSYLTEIGSTLRMDWKPKNSGQYAMYFKCTSRLVETFRVLFKHTLEFEGNGAIVFRLDDELSTDALKKCIKAALTKHLPTLGI